MQLVRLPNVFTVLADVGAAYLLVAGGAAPVLRFFVILLAGVSLYWAGMILNDVFDVEKDTAERAERPIPSGAISKSSASRAGWGLLVVGVLLASLSGFLPVGTDNVPTDTPATTWLPMVVAIALAALVVGYAGGEGRVSRFEFSAWRVTPATHGRRFTRDSAIFVGNRPRFRCLRDGYHHAGP